jgi:hypothetical protein
MTRAHDENRAAAEQPADEQPASQEQADGVDLSAVNDQIAKEQDQGFRGVAVDPNPNEAYSLQTGPDSPTNTGERLEQHTLKEG